MIKSVEAFIEAANAEPDASKLQPGFYQLQRKMRAADALAVVLDPSARVAGPGHAAGGPPAGRDLKRLPRRPSCRWPTTRRRSRAPGKLGLPGLRQGQPGGLPVPGDLRHAAGRDRRRRPQAAVRRPTRPRADEAGVERTKRTPVRDRHHRQPGARPRRATPRTSARSPGSSTTGSSRGCRCSSTPRSTTRSTADKQIVDLRRTWAPTRRTTPTSTPACRRRRSTRPGWRR